MDACLPPGSMLATHDVIIIAIAMHYISVNVILSGGNDKGQAKEGKCLQQMALEEEMENLHTSNVKHALLHRTLSFEHSAQEDAEEILNM